MSRIKQIIGCVFAVSMLASLSACIILLILNALTVLGAISGNLLGYLP